MIQEQKATEDYGKVFGFALVYSGNFEINAELSSHDLLRISLGINSFDFRYPLQHGASFVTPEVAMTMSCEGTHKASTQFHHFVNHYLIPKPHRFKDRPIVINNWEATYFDFNQKKLLAIAKKAKKLGIELLCLDDGWFGKRNDDFSSLGDWHVNKKKIPKGIAHLSKKIRHIGLEFGIWVEPEMVSVDSALYKAHPEWAIHIPHRDPSVGRNQLMLDLTNDDVRTYIKTAISNVIEEANVSYVKWDMNRNISDVYSQTLPKDDQGKFHYLYVVGLYDILQYLTTAYPHVLFESCSSGGNRFDLGMLKFMPQTWTSDNTDAYERLLIQEGTSMAYPLSSISNHVSGDRSHQVLRHTPLETRFHVAAFGVLGYELDVTELTRFDAKIIEKQIAFYKQYRSVFQYGSFKRLKSIREGNYTVWMVTSQDEDVTLLGFFQKHALPNPAFQKLQVKGLKQGTYKVTSRPQYTNIRTFGSLVNEALPIKVKINHFLHNAIANRYLFKLDTFEQYLSDTQLAHSDLLLHHMFTGTGYNDHVMMVEDYGSRLFIIQKEIDNEESSPK
jgi:alpha-galactosidase